MRLPESAFGRPLIGERRRRCYNLALDPELKDEAQAAALLQGDSFSMWVEEAAKNRLRFEKTELSVLNLHGVGEIQMPHIGYSGGVAFDFRCGEEPTLSLAKPSSASIMDEMGSATGTLDLGERQCEFECADLTSETSINGQLDLHPAPQSELVLRFSQVSDSAPFAIFLSNVPVESPATTSVRGVEVSLERILRPHHPLRFTRLVRRRPETSLVTARCTLKFRKPPIEFYSAWAMPISKFLQAYARRLVDVVGWGRVDDEANLLELHLPADTARPSTRRGPCFTRREYGVEWEPFLQKGLASYLRLSETLELGAFSQYLAMAGGQGVTVNGMSALLLPATELIANLLGKQHDLVIPERKNLNSKVKAILNATGPSMSKDTQRALDKIVRARLRNPLFHEGLPKASVGTIDNAKINDFLEGLAISLHSTLIGNDATHCYHTDWPQKFYYMTPAEWLASDHMKSALAGLP